jgi:ATP-dependent protease ClpP protease subunit
MQATTWYSADEAVAAGLADSVRNSNATAPENRASQLVRARTK